MAIQLITHPEIETLAQEMARSFQTQPLQDPFAEEWVLISHASVKAWLNPFLAQRLGVWSQAWLSYPRVAIWKLMRAYLPGCPRVPALDTEACTWAILELLPELLEQPPYAPLKRYFAEDDSPGKRLQLARALASNYQRYGVYSRKWLAHWQSGKGQHWQAHLWQALCNHWLQQHPDQEHVPHRQQVQQRCLEALRAGRGRSRQLPQRITLFALEDLQPFYLELLIAFSERIEIRWYQPTATAQPLQQGGQPLHPLYAANGRLERAMLAFLQQRGKAPQVLQAKAWQERLPDPPGGGTTNVSLLQRLQAQIYWGQPRVAGPLPADDSLQIHSCHSPLREVEALENYLYACFASLPDLQPAEIGVWVPHLDQYAPLIHSVFGSPGNARGTRLPYRLIETHKRQQPLQQALSSLFALQGSRLQLAEVLGFLEQAPVRQAFGISLAELEQCQSWLEALQVRWGKDAADRRRWQLPAYAAHSWKKGLERLLLGYALPDLGQGPLQELLPEVGVEGQQTQLLGRLLAFFEALEQALTFLEGPHDLETWVQGLDCLIKSLLAPEPQQQEAFYQLLDDLQELREHAEWLSEQQAASLPLGWVWPWLEAQWSRVNDRVVASGAIAFGTPASLQQMPFRVLACLGLNHGSFPAAAAENDLDLLLQAPGRGDPDPQLASRNQFLQGLMASRERLYISFIGQAIRDNQPLPPAVPVAELITELQAITAGSPRPFAITRHPLHPFDPRYFGPDQPLGVPFDASSCQLARQFAGRQLQPSLSDLQPLPPAADSLDQTETASETAPGISPFVDGPLPALQADDEPACLWQEVSQFYRHPGRSYLQRRLGIRLQREQERLDPLQEPYQLEGLQRYQLGEDYLAWRQAGGQEVAFKIRLCSADRLPQGLLGERLFEQLISPLRPLADALAALGPPSLPPQPFELQLADLRVSGDLPAAWPQGWLLPRAGRLGPAERLHGWLQHLLLACLRSQGQLLDDPRQVWLLGLNDQMQVLQVGFAAVAEPAALLLPYLRAYQRGLQLPLPFALRSSWKLGQPVTDKHPQSKLQQAAEAAWQGGFQGFSENQDPAYSQLLAPGWYLEAEAWELAQQLFGPLLSHQQEQPFSSFHLDQRSVNAERQADVFAQPG